MFDRCNLDDTKMTLRCAHSGVGEIRFTRLAEKHNLSGDCSFMDLAILPPGVSIGRHRHAKDEEEFYLILNGSGEMWRNGEEFPVKAGDLVRNPPGGEHSLINTGNKNLRIFVFEVRVSA